MQTAKKDFEPGPDLLPAPVGDKKANKLTISDSGVLLLRSFGDIKDLAQTMCKTGLGVPAHLRGDTVGTCISIIMRARAWGMDPFAVADKSFVINSRLGYEAQLILAVINTHAPIKGRLVPAFEGTKEKRVCKLEPISLDGQVLPYESPEFAAITPKNSPLWKNDPDQQHFYYSARAWCRRYFPELLLGVYDREEVQQMRDVTPVNYTEDEEPLSDHIPESVETVLERTGVITPKAEVLPPEYKPDGEVPPELQLSNLIKGVNSCQDKTELDDLLRDAEPFLSWLKKDRPAESQKFWRTVIARKFSPAATPTP